VKPNSGELPWQQAERLRLQSAASIRSASRAPAREAGRRARAGGVAGAVRDRAGAVASASGVRLVAAFAEAATIGGLADWYAVVALFRKPLGLPIPHTAIIPANRDRIAEKLGESSKRTFSKQVRSKRNCAKLISHLSSPTGWLTASAAPIWRASCCGCCRKP